MLRVLAEDPLAPPLAIFRGLAAVLAGSQFCALQIFKYRQDSQVVLIYVPQGGGDSSGSPAGTEAAHVKFLWRLTLIK